MKKELEKILKEYRKHVNDQDEITEDLENLIKQVSPKQININISKEEINKLILTKKQLEVIAKKHITGFGPAYQEAMMIYVAGMQKMQKIIKSKLNDLT